MGGGGKMCAFALAIGLASPAILGALITVAAAQRIARFVRRA